MRATIALLAAMACQPLFAADVPVSPGEPPITREVSAKPGQLVPLAVDVESTWTLASEVSLLFYPNGKSCHCVVPASLTGRVIFIVTPNTGGTASRIVIVVGGEPLPPGPVPPVPPKPPTPPAPVPPELKQKIETAFKADGSPKASALMLASAFTAASKAVLEKDADGDYLVDTTRKLLAAVGKASKLTDAELSNVRKKVIAAELLALMGDLDKPFNDTTRRAVSSLYAQAAAVLEELGK